MQDDYGVIVFRSRQHALRFQEQLKSRGISAGLISTPERLSTGCGVSVRVNTRDLPRVTPQINPRNQDNIVGVYKACQTNGRTSFQNIR